MGALVLEEGPWAQRPCSGGSGNRRGDCSGGTGAVSLRVPPATTAMTVKEPYQRDEQASPRAAITEKNGWKQNTSINTYTNTGNSGFHGRTVAKQVFHGANMQNLCLKTRKTRVAIFDLVFFKNNVSEIVLIPLIINEIIRWRCFSSFYDFIFVGDEMEECPSLLLSD